MSSTNPTHVETEWDALQRKYGNLPPLPHTETEEERSKKLVESLEHVDVLAEKTLKQLGELEDDIEEEVLDKYRRRRLEELKRKSKRNRFGEVYHLAKDDFIRAVTNASMVDPLQVGNQADDDVKAASSSSASSARDDFASGGTWIFVHLYRDAVEACQLLNRAMDAIARKYPMVKFLRAISTDVIPGYPDEKLPTVLLYFGGTCRRQIVGASEWGGSSLCSETLEYALSRKFRIIDVDAEEDDADAWKSDKKYIHYSSCENDDSDEERSRVAGKGYSSLKLDSMMQHGV